jgi:hypothetical protein
MEIELQSEYDKLVGSFKRNRKFFPFHFIPLTVGLCYYFKYSPRFYLKFLRRDFSALLIGSSLHLAVFTFYLYTLAYLTLGKSPIKFMKLNYYYNEKLNESDPFKNLSPLEMIVALEESAKKENFK